MQVGKMYKHLRNTDVALKVLNSIKRDDGYSLIVDWFNIVNPKNVFLIDRFSTEFVTNAQVENWKPYVETSTKN